MVAAELDPRAAGGTDPLDRARRLVTPRMRAAVDRLNSASRRVAGYHLGWWDENGVPLAGDGGKAVRPALAMLAAQAVGGPESCAAAPGAAVELVHNYSLLHDDIMDQDRTRRGRPTAWTVFGMPAAVLAGDALQTLGVEALVEAGPPLATEGVPRFNADLLRLVDGQVADMAFEGRTDVGLDECLTMAGDKTSSLFAAACELGALAGGGSPRQARLLREFGEHLGLAFQLVDDLKGIWGDPEATGKPVGADLRTRKKTLPVVAALTAGNGAARRLAQLYHGAGPLDEASVRRATELVEEAGGRAWAEQEIGRRLAEAFASLRAANLDPRYVEELTALARRLGTGPAAGRPTGGTAPPTHPGSGSAPDTGAPFQLPAEFRQPHPARLNPHLASARAHTLAWARKTGLNSGDHTAPGSEARQAPDDYALLGSYVHPDAPRDTLELLADWYLLLFHLDDYFLQEFKHTGGAAGKEYLERLLQFTPLEPDQRVPQPANPVERGLADLWQRTVPVASAAWRHRLRGHLRDNLAGHLEELDQVNTRHLPNPIEYLDMKRRVNGGPIAMSFIELARAAEVPEALVQDPTMRALHDATIDSGVLYNDIFSYQREVMDDGEHANMVLVLEKFADCDTQQAVDTTSDLITSQLEQSENIIRTRIPALCDEHGLSPAECARLLSYIQGLRDYQSGWRAWHNRATRYANGRTGAGPAHQPPPTAALATGPAPWRPPGPTGLGTATATLPLQGIRR